jgi:NADH:ubiquinone oxidoreductase subunit F (NADH-binding)
VTAVLAPGGLLDATGAALADHLATHGPLPPADAAALAGSAGLTTRGGAAAAVRIRSVARAALLARRAAVVVADGTGGDPAALGDRELLTRAPHLVLDGLALAGRTLGATTLVLAAPPDRLPAVASALAERGDAVRLDAVAPSAVAGPWEAGEEAALLAVLEGWLPASCAQQWPGRGLRGRPTLVLDVETLARLALLARGGTGAAGARLLTRRWEVAGVPHADVVDADPGTRLADLLPLGGARAVLVGGGSGTWLPVETARGLRLDGADLAAAGAHPGAAVVAALPGDRCGLLETARVLASPAGRCGRCAGHLSRVAAALADPAPPAPGLFDVAHRRSWGRCRHADGAARLVAGALEVFADELTAHRYGSCTATARAPFLPVPGGP